MKFFKAFTIAEMLITVAILGVVAVITIPNLIKNQIEAQNRTKVKKAMSVYERALSKMAIENELKTDSIINAWANEEANCGNTFKYFKASQGQGCMFKTPDGVWWDITNILRPMIALKEENLKDEKAADQHDTTAYYMVGHFDNIGILRVNDNSYEHSQPNNDTNIMIVRKLWSLLGIAPKYPLFSKLCNNNECKVANINDAYGRTKISFHNCDVNGNNCEYTMVFGEYDEHGNATSMYWKCDNNQKNCQALQKYHYDYNTGTADFYWCNTDGSGCKKTGSFELNDKGQKTAWYYNCNNPDDKTTCKNNYQYKYDDSGKLIWYKSSQDKAVQKYEYDANGNKTVIYYCDVNGNNCKKYNYSYEW